MTTIVATREWMAADQRATDDGPMCHDKKLRYIGDSIFGMAGDCHAAMVVLRWLETAKRDPKVLYEMFGEKDISWRYELVLLELSPTGLALWNGWGISLPILDDSYAIGTGAHAALAALDSGATPEACIQQAAKRDQYSGVFREPEVLHLLPTTKKRRKRG
jgi:hypothetical protein